MRIAHVITRMIVGGAQENTFFSCQDLARIHGDDVLLITGPSLGPEGSLLDTEPEIDFEIVEIPSLRRSIHPAHDYKAYRAIRRELKKFNPDVVHTHSAKGGLLGRLAAWSLKSPAVIHTVHGAPFHDYQSRLARLFFQRCEKYAARRCHALVSVADAMTDLLVDAAVAPRSKFTTVYSGMRVEPFLAADETREAVRRELGFAPEDVVVGKIARLFHLKGHCYLIEAAKEVVARRPDVKFLLVGDGILWASLRQQIDAAGLKEHFHFTGLVAPERIPALLGAMDVLVHTSLREGLARTLPQALIAGKPAVSYDIDGAREVVIPGVTGYLLPPKSIQPLSEALVDLAADSELRSTLGRNGRERFTDDFRHETMAARLRAIYQQTLDRNQGISVDNLVSSDSVDK